MIEFKKIVIFGRKNKPDDRRLLASTDDIDHAKIYHAENGKINYNKLNFLKVIFFI